MLISAVISHIGAVVGFAAGCDSLWHRLTFGLYHLARIIGRDVIEVIE